ncbi:MAG TPA: aldehyde:ferredoxin oxidoreductase [Desulfobacteraceae bacterium]|nr:aldehyde:ferredoxin oxidoreductase [Desulfobacteraceae bacterium]
MRGFFNRLLVIDAGTGKFHVEKIEDEVLAETLGGKGLATRILLEKNPPGVDPFSPENHFLIALGPATDSALYGSCRHGLFSKSPLTGFYAESYSGGSLAIPISRTGFDAIAVHGASDKPVWLEISEDNVKFHEAAHLCGTDTYFAEDEILRRVDGSGAGAMVIGPAGENLVKFAVVENDRWRSAGRTGLGAVLGAKNIKGIAFRGDRRREFADPEGMKVYARKMLVDLKDHKATLAYRNLGTPMMVAMLNNAGGFPTRYWSEGTMKGWEKIGADSMKERLNPSPRACKTCFLGCGKLIEVQEGRHRGLKLEGPEYETLYAFGGLCLIDEIEEIAYLNDICDRLGLDTITAGNLSAFAIEASMKGAVDEKLEYGNPEAVADLLGKISRREGIGDVLAGGICEAARKWGMEDIAVHVKGLEPAGYDPRALKGMGLAYAVSDRGACHLRTTFYKAELAGLIDPDTVDGKSEMFVDFEDRCTLFDCMILCRFYRDFYLWDELSDVVRLTTGISAGADELRRIAATVTDSARLFNIREGLTTADDRLPERFFKESLPGGQKITREQMATLVSDYYRLRGWDTRGVPKR